MMRVIGMMSGTSADGIDTALVRSKVTKGQIVTLIILLVSSACLAQVKEQPARFDSTRLANVLACLQSFVSSGGVLPPRYDRRSFHVRYRFVLRSTSTSGELDMIVYGPQGKSGALFENDVDGQEIGPGNGHTFTISKGQLELDEMPSADAPRAIREEFDAVSKRTEIVIPASLVTLGPAICSLPGQL